MICTRTRRYLDQAWPARHPMITWAGTTACPGSREIVSCSLSSAAFIAGDAHIRGSAFDTIVVLTPSFLSSSTGISRRDRGRKEHAQQVRVSGKLRYPSPLSNRSNSLSPSLCITLSIWPSFAPAWRTHSRMIRIHHSFGSRPACLPYNGYCSFIRLNADMSFPVLRKHQSRADQA